MGKLLIHYSTMKIQTFWDLKLLYKSDKDPQIEKDLKTIETLCVSFEKKYKGKEFTKTPQALLKILDESEKLSEFMDSHAPSRYFHFKTDLDSNDSKSFAISTKYGHRLTEASNKIKFLGLEIAKIPTNKQGIFLNYPAFKPYKYLLIQIFANAKYNLSEGEEQLEDLLAQPGYGMWVDTQEKLLNQQVIKHKGKDIPIAKAMAGLSDMSKKDRREIHNKINDVLKSISHMSEGELNAIYNFKKIMDKRRGYKKPYSATILGYENDEKAIESFISLVSKNFHIAHRFYKLHAKLLKEKKIKLADRGAKIGNIKTKFDFPKSVAMLRSVLGGFDKDYLDIFNKFLENGQIDVYPKKGKTGGAYCSGYGQLPTFVLLNHVDTIKSLETLAHEMGHVIHTELSKSQPSRYRDYSTATAEVASTFFEQIISEEVEKNLSKKEHIVLLHNRILGDISIIFRQVACFNFELELHENIRKDGQVSKENIAKLMSKHLKSYLGEVVEVTDDDGYFYVYWSHIRRFFYVYSYAYGQLISRALYEKWKEDPAYAKKIKQFLSAGGSMKPEDIFKSIGIDTSKNSFFETGLKGIERDIDKLKRLSKGFKAR
ncbi:MAG: Oligoendopeptidase, pepF/M3 family [Parcubacteria group bacterium GW2011_GWA1_47_11]|nr:MAG: Oligoendopeptidase, pepF/M3 family [Parcubacteria group bacterium GW2011_GWA1_47_11]